MLPQTIQFPASGPRQDSGPGHCPRIGLARAAVVAGLALGVALAGMGPAAVAAPKTPRGTVTTPVSTALGRGTTSVGSDPVIAVDRAQRPVVATASGAKLALLRYKKKGKLDKRFSRDGIARLKIRKNLSVSDIVIDSRHRLVVVGASNGSSGARSRLIVLRVTKKGKLDKKFGKRGVVTIPHASGNAITIDRAGRLVISGRSTVPSAALVARLDGRGRLDTGFGSGGIARVSVYGSQESSYVGTSAGETVIDASGRIVTELRVFRGIGQPSETGVARFTASGSLDSGFGESGGYTSGTLGLSPGGAISRGIAARPGGGYVVSGAAHGQFFLQRYDADGFSDGSPVLTDVTRGFMEGGNAMVADSHGRVVSVGQAYPRLAVVRYGSDGGLDAGFASNGVYRPKKLKGASSVNATDVATGTRGRLWVVGIATAKGAASDRLVVMRLKDNGQPDRTWRSRR